MGVGHCWYVACAMGVLCSSLNPVGVSAGATFVAGPLQDRYLEWFLHRELDGKCYGTVAQLTEERSHRRVRLVA